MPQVHYIRTSEGDRSIESIMLSDNTCDFSCSMLEEQFSLVNTEQKYWLKIPAFSLSLVTALSEDNNDGIGDLRDFVELIQHQNFLGLE